MKKIILSLLFVSTLSYFTACKSDKKKEDKKEVVKKAAFSLKNAKNSVNWRAYKTTKKVGVKGSFTQINITAGGNGNSIKEAVNNAEFSIPVSSIFSANEERDAKIVTSFFGAMKDTELLSGRFEIKTDSTGYVLIKMNGIIERLPFDYKIKDKQFSLETEMNIANWKALSAIASLNKVCGDLHKGADGVSMTWEEVGLQVSSVFE